MRHMRCKNIGLLLVICMLLLSSCGKNTASPDDSPTPEEAPPSVTVPESDPIIDTKEVLRAPLTGLAWKEGAEDGIHQRPIAVMINNERKARPQSGLSKADVLIEVLAEGGITRIVAIYHSQMDYEGDVGPVRSIRPYLIELGESYGAVLAHAGASNDGYYILQRQHKEHLDEITNAGAYFWRDSSRRAPHNLYTNLEKLLQGAEKKGYALTADVPALSFQQEGEVSSSDSLVKEAAEQIDVTFYKSSAAVAYTYDANQQNYVRYVEGEPHIDKVTEEPLRAANVIVAEAAVKVLDDKGRLAVDLETTGDAVWFNKGQAVRGTWVRNDSGPIQFTVDGNIVEMGTGITHMMVVPTDGGLDSHVSWSLKSSE